MFICAMPYERSRAPVLSIKFDCSNGLNVPSLFRPDSQEIVANISALYCFSAYMSTNCSILLKVIESLMTTAFAFASVTKLSFVTYSTSWFDSATTVFTCSTCLISVACCPVPEKATMRASNPVFICNKLIQVLYHQLEPTLIQCPHPGAWGVYRPVFRHHCHRIHPGLHTRHLFRYCVSVVALLASRQSFHLQ